MATMLQYGYLLHMEASARRVADEKGKGSKDGCEHLRLVRVRMRAIDRRCFILFPSACFAVAVLYWAVHLTKYSRGYD